MCPLTFMNLSGQAVQPVRDFYKIENDDLLVVCDDFALPLGKLRIRAQGSAGGQRVWTTSSAAWVTDELPGCELGIGPLPENWEAANFVLGKFSKEEAAEATER